MFLLWQGFDVEVLLASQKLLRWYFPYKQIVSFKNIIQVLAIMLRYFKICTKFVYLRTLINTLSQLEFWFTFIEIYQIIIEWMESCVLLNLLWYVFTRITIDYHITHEWSFWYSKNKECKYIFKFNIVGFICFILPINKKVKYFDLFSEDKIPCLLWVIKF